MYFIYPRSTKEKKNKCIFFFTHKAPRSSQELVYKCPCIQESNWNLDQPRTLQASPIKLQQLREKKKTAKDKTLAPLRDISYEDWPNSRSECRLPACDFCNFREDLTIEYGIILKCDCSVVPPMLRPDILKTIHRGHLGVEKCVLRASSAVYWPGITDYIAQVVRQCEACQKLNTRRERKRTHCCRAAM